MNKFFGIGRITRGLEIRYNTNNLAVCRFTLAINRPKQKDKEDVADFISCVCFGKTAEILAKYQGKGSQIAIAGRIQTGSYDDKNGKKVYTTDIVVEEVKFVGTKNSQNKEQTTSNEQSVEQSQKEPNYEQLGAKTVMNEDYNPELQIDDLDLPF